ncbi:hypothetical protein EES45_22900 [Streptomyces sp. ADI97-07]|uniref:hypothetical protein n=1 Tax=Streptomyces sp. ADI97-07 TaxID=1522762 RepID=UPI000FB76D42|nr:hypothetical protein [Streptomyces sp. ADI97-07]RPK76611.1 hypothetical protein EES45_22900 [Streptomyces sp. ADI97-07]
MRYGAGGIAGLAHLLTEHGEAIEADLREHYGARLSDLFRRDSAGLPLLTLRELGVLLRQLPGTARTRLALGDRDGLWGLSEQLQAAEIDTLRVANWQRANSGLQEHEQSPRPEPIERPGVQGKRRITAAELLDHQARTRSHAPPAAAA